MEGKAAADAEVRAETPRLEKALEALKHENERLQQALASAMKHIEAASAEPADAEPSTAPSDSSAVEAADAAEAAFGAEEGYVSIAAQIVQLQEKIRLADEAADYGECGRLTEKIRALEARQKREAAV